VIDLDGRYGQWFAELDADTVIVRPDFYVYSAGAATELDVALRMLDSQLDGASADSTRESAEQIT